MDIIDVYDLASYLRDGSLASDDSLAQIVDLTNTLVSEEWATPVDPVPVKIKLLTLNVAARAWVNDPSKSHLESYSRTLDDASKTEKYRASSENGSVYLTDSEKALLDGRHRHHSVRLTIYGQV